MYTVYALNFNNVISVKVYSSESDDSNSEEDTREKTSEDLSFMIDRAVDNFFNNHVMKFSALGRDVSVPNTGKIIFLSVENNLFHNRFCLSVSTVLKIVEDST